MTRFKNKRIEAGIIFLKGSPILMCIVTAPAIRIARTKAAGKTRNGIHNPARRKRAEPTLRNPIK
jgi:hypothetical protein